MAVRAVDAEARRTATRTARHPRTAAAPQPSASAGAVAIAAVAAPPVAVVGTERAPQLATITQLRPVSRVEALAAVRKERRRWLLLSAVVFATPFAACIGVLEVVR